MSLAGPLILGQLAAVAITFVDTLMAGRYDAVTLAGVAIGGAVWSAGYMFVIGILMAIPPHISQLAGAGRVGETGRFARQAGYLAAGLALVYLLFLRGAEPLLRVLKLDPAIIPEALDYLDAIAWGTPALCGFLLLRTVSEGLSITRASMYFGFVGLLINIPANYVLIFGHLGFPAMGASGCGYASALVQWGQFIGILLYAWHNPRYRNAKIFARLDPPRLPEITRILKIGLPIGSSIFIEGSLFVTVALLMGSLGPVTTAAHQAAINFSALVFMIPLGIGMAITVRIGHALGRREVDGIRSAAKSGFILVLVTQTLSASLMLLFPELIAVTYTNDLDVQRVILDLLLLAAIFQLPDGLQVAGACALRGLKDTRIPMLYTLLAYWVIGLPLGYQLGVVLDHGAKGMWIGLIGGLSVAAVLMISRFMHLLRSGITIKDPL